MITNSKLEKILRLTVLTLTTMVIAVGVFLLCYHFDNKYTAKGPQPMGGVLLLDEQDLAQYPAIYLVRDWEIYRGKLLTPEDFKQDAPFPNELVFIGQYGGFEGHVDGNVANKNPHGSVTYRLNIALPKETKSYTLELPEIYSAYKLYINGNLMAEMGETGSTGEQIPQQSTSPSPPNYKPETGNSLVTVQAAGRMEILIAVSDYSHFYSGMVYPPAFGNPSAVAKILNTRFAIRLVTIAASLCIGLLYFCIWVLTKKDKRAQTVLPLLYSALCLCFVLYTCYPVVKTLFTGGMGFYSLENFAYCAMFLLVLIIQRRVTNGIKKWLKPFAAFGIFTCSCALLIPHILGDNLALMMFYSRLIGLYTWTCALYLTVSATASVWRCKVNSKAMLVGVIIFDTALVMDRLLTLFEPIRFGWFTELAGGVLVLLIGFVMAMEVARQFELRQAMESRVESVSKTLDVQKAYYPIILEKEEETRAAKHDLRHHMAVMRELVTDNDLTKLIHYLDAYNDKRITGTSATYCKHYVANMILGMYAELAERQSTIFNAVAHLPENVAIDDVDLCVILGNLLENALEASARIPVEQRLINVKIGFDLNRLAIFIENNFDGSFHMENGRFYSHKQTEREGIGLASVQAVVTRYGSRADFYKDEQNRFHSEVLIQIKNEESDTSYIVDQVGVSRPTALH